MGYIHRGDYHDFGDEPTEYGKKLAEKMGEVETREEKARRNYKRVVAEVKARNREIEQQNERKIKEWEKKCKQWKEECANLWQKYFMDTAKWEEECKKSRFGFFRKILGIGKPKLKLPEKPQKPTERDLEPIPEYDMWKFLPIDK